MIVNDYSAELVVASTFAEAGWDVYFPHRDKGFDFIISKYIEGFGELIRPVQVKGKYPTDGKGDKKVYGYIGKLTKIHTEMVLAMPYYKADNIILPEFIAYMPIATIKECSKGYQCQPSSFKNGNPVKRPYYTKFFDRNGILELEKEEWKNYSTDYWKWKKEECLSLRLIEFYNVKII